MNIRLLAVPAILLALAACSNQTEEKQGNQDMSHMDHDTSASPAMAHHESMWESVNTAVAVLYPTKGNSASGTLTFTKTGDSSVHIHGTITGLEPNSTHAFHIHEFGDASSADGMSAGGHYNPEHHVHGGPNSPEHHAGDLGNITADGSGSVTIDMDAEGAIHRGDEGSGHRSVGGPPRQAGRSHVTAGGERWAADRGGCDWDCQVEVEPRSRDARIKKKCRARRGTFVEPCYT